MKNDLHQKLKEISGTDYDQPIQDHYKNCPWTAEQQKEIGTLWVALIGIGIAMTFMLV